MVYMLSARLGGLDSGAKGTGQWNGTVVSTIRMDLRAGLEMLHPLLSLLSTYPNSC
jgi:hypothetical protein